MRRATPRTVARRAMSALLEQGRNCDERSNGTLHDARSFRGQGRWRAHAPSFTTRVAYDATARWRGESYSTGPRRVNVAHQRDHPYRLERGTSSDEDARAPATGLRNP